MNLPLISKDLIIKICWYLSLKNLNSLSKTCKYLFSITQEPNALYHLSIKDLILFKYNRNNELNHERLSKIRSLQINCSKIFGPSSNPLPISWSQSLQTLFITNVSKHNINLIPSFQEIRKLTLESAGYGFIDPFLAKIDCRNLTELSIVARYFGNIEFLLTRNFMNIKKLYFSDMSIGKNPKYLYPAKHAFHEMEFIEFNGTNINCTQFFVWILKYGTKKCVMINHPKRVDYGFGEKVIKDSILFQEDFLNICQRIRSLKVNFNLEQMTGKRFLFHCNVLLKHNININECCLLLDEYALLHDKIYDGIGTLQHFTENTKIIIDIGEWCGYDDEYDEYEDEDGLLDFEIDSFMEDMSGSYEYVFDNFNKLYKKNKNIKITIILWGKYTKYTYKLGSSQTDILRLPRKCLKRSRELISSDNYLKVKLIAIVTGFNLP